MNDRHADREYLEKATVALQKALGRIRTMEERSRERIAIVGMGCRYPGGVTDPESLWGLLDAGVDAVTEVPAERWDIGALYDPDPDAAGKMVTRSGGFVRGVERFDAGFFGISPREAMSLDPQQRLLLETSWEALERAGIAPDGLTGSSTGVFVGLMYQDYGTLAGGLERMDGYVGTGSAPSIASGRISYVLGLHGPSMTVDTACSSSLVTVHLACQALRSGECSMALAGGASLMMTPSAFVEFSRLRGLALDGRCKSFSAAADGVGWSEGCGMLVLERLSDARQNGHAVLAVIRGSAVNQDGRSNGLTAPNGPSQEAVIRRALGQAGVRPSEVDYVECHGTGTSLGDPIEVQALGAVLSEGRDRDRPVVIGSVKSNLGHTQAAAGVAGIIKTVLALEHGRIPRNLHFDAPSPHIAWDALPVRVAAEAVAWPRNDRPRIAGVSSFGMSGTNAHVVLEEALAQEGVVEAPPIVTRSAELVVLSAKSAAALAEAAGRLRAHLEGHPEQVLGDVAFSLAATRTHHEHRLALSVQTRTELLAALDATSRGDSPRSTSHVELGRSGKLTWLFAGQGAQALGMGRELHAEWAVFRDALEQAWAALDPHLEERLRDVMWAASGTASAAKLDETAYTQPALFALEVALSALWRSWGIEPDFVAGHSIGELAAAQVAGVLSLADAARLVAARGRLMQALPRGGAMVAIGASERDVAAAVEPHAASVSIAALNGPESVVISGAEASVLSIAETFASRGVRTKRLAVSHAFHSPLMEPMLDAFRSVAESVRYHAPRVPLVSNVTGGVAGGEILRAEYWVRQVREAVRFGDGVRALHEGGAKRFLEVGPRATLLGLVPGCLPPDAQEEVVLWASLRAERAEAQAVLEALGGVYADGGTVDWRGVFPGGGRRVQLPTYPWERQRYWAETKPTRGVGAETEHPLLGVRVSLAGATTVYESVWSLTEQRWLGEHRVGDQVFMPGAGIAEVVRAAGEQCLGEPAEVLSLVLEEPLVLPEHGGQRVQVVVTQEDNRTEATVYSQPAEARPGAEWTRHAGAQLRAVSVTGAAAARLDVMAARRRCTEAVDVAQAYEAFSAAGLEYGAAFRGMRSLHRGQGEALAEVVLPEVVEGVDTYGVHPALLDAAFHAVIGLSRIERGLESLWLPFAIDRLRVFQTGARSATAHVRALASQVAGEAFAADVTLTDDQGQVLVEVSGLRGRQADVGDLAKRASRGDALYRVEWPVVSLPSVRSPLRLPPGRWRVVADSGNAVAEALTERLRARGAECVLVPGVVGLADVVPAEHVVCVWGKKPGEEASDAARRNASEGLVVSQLLARQSSALQLRWVTQGAVAVTPAEGAAVGLASLWGLGRTVRQEHPELGCRLIDVDAKASVDAAVAALVDELCAGDDEPEVAWRDGERHVGRIMRAVARASVSRRGWRPDGTALVTGGLGALGLHVARWLVGRGVKHLVLTGRRGTETPGARQAVAELEGRGAQVTVASVDVADREALRAVLEAIPRELPLRGVVHAAGVLDDGVLLEQTAERLGRVMSPKVEGACHLDALTRGADLDFFVLFSSAAGTLGSAGQAGYTAANACLDALAAQRVAEGLPGQSLAWGLWTDAEGKAAGMASRLDRAQQTRAVQGGIDAVSPAQAMALLEAALTRPESQLMPVPLDVRRMRKAFDGVVPPIWRALVRESPRAARKDGAWAEEIGTLREAERMAAVLHVVQTEVARVLGLGGPETVAADRPLRELGLESLMTIDLRVALGHRVGVTLPATLAFDYPTSEAIAKYLIDNVLALIAPKAVAAPLPVLQPVDEPIAIVGMGCRYPGGVTDPDSLWGLLDAGVDAVTEVPAERWDIGALYDPDPDAAGKMVTRSGGFVRDVDRFDASFFGISPREAVSLDPQHRLLLETSWEALERAGIAPDGLTGSTTGVFVGLMHRDYGTLVGGLEKLDGYVGTGSWPSVASGRISYVLGLQGPSMTVDTACSSSLVTVHLACQALRSGECSMALAGGATLMLTASAFVEFSRLRGLALDGRCKSFSAAADGVGWGEGCGMLVLERLSDARRNGHPVLAVIRGSAVNQDGRSNGLTAPNGPSQEAVIRRALGQAGVRPSEVDYVECHGTGTSLGDPIEVQALGAVLSEGRDRDRPVVIGSVKSNLGHTQAAAGVAGIIKTVLALEHGRIPKNLHFDAPSPHIAWDALPVKVASEAVEWRRNGARRIAGVSSFGVSGTNAHVVLEEAPAREDAAEAPRLVARAAELVVLSAKSAAALDAAAGRLAAFVEAHAEHELGDLAYSLATTRAHHEHRLALSVQTRTELLAGLDAASRGELSPSASRAELGLRGGKLAWLFTGQGSQTPGMGRGLHAEWPVFRDALDQAWGALDPHLEVPLRDVMWAAPGTALAACLDQTAYTQPALFALEVALAALWRSWGVLPDLVAGHSIGELAAAHVAGLFSLDDAARLVAARGRLMQALPALGAMVSIGAPESVVAAEIGAYAASVSIAAVNGPESVVISGAEASVLSIAETFASRGVRTKRLVVSHAFHSPLMEPMLEAYRRVAESVSYHEPRVPMVSNVTGGVAGGEILQADYWVRHVREVVRFGDGVQALQQAGAKRFLEVGPRPTLLGLVPGCLPPEASEQTVLWASLRAGRAEAQAVLEALGGYCAQGGIVDWRGVFPAGGRRVQLPTYPWERQRYWIEGSRSPARGGEATGHALLGVQLSVAAGADALYESVLSRAEQPWLYQHRVGERALVPGAAIAELLRAAGERRFEGDPTEVLSLVLQEPLVLPEHGEQRVQVVVIQADDRTEATVYSQPAEAGPEAEWTRHASAQLRPLTEPAPARLDVMAVRRRCSEVVDVAQAYEASASAGLEYGAAFRGMRSLHRGQGEALAEVVLPEAVAGVHAYGVHPALLDAAFHAAMGLSRGERGTGSLWLPFAIDRLRLFHPGATSATAHVRALANQVDGDALAVDVTLTDDQGQVLVEVSGLRGRQADVEAIERSASGGASEVLYRVEWPVVALPTPRSTLPLPPGRWRVVAEREDVVAEALTARLRARGAECVLVQGVVGLEDVLPAEHVVCVWGKKPGEEASDAALRNASEGLVVSQLLARQSSALRLRWVTRGAVAVTPAEGAAVELASLWGLGRTVRQEHPELGCRLIDVDAKASVDAAVAALVDELCAGDDEPEVAWRDGERHAGRIMRAVARASVSRRGWRPDGTALVTGGLGALGLHVARWLVGRGVKHLVLTGRRGTETPGARQAVAELEGRGAQVTVASVDVADREALRAVLEAIPRELPLRGVVHAAGVLDDGVLLEQTAERLGRVMSPKVEGACHLDALTRGADLDFFVLFSSAAGTLGSAGQAGYTAANACLDALAAQRVAEGLPGQSLAWGLWTDAEGKAAGMASGLDRAQQTRAAQGGIDAVSPAQAMALLEAALTRPESQLMPVPLDVRRMRKAFDGVVPPVWRALVRESPRAARKDGAWAEEIGTLQGAERMAAVLHVVRTEVARVLGLGGPEMVAADRPLRELGLESLMTIDLRVALGHRVGATLPATLAFDYPTSEAIAKYLLDNVLALIEPKAVAAFLPVLQPVDEPIAIVGMGCRYPGGVTDPDSLWALLDAGVDAVTEVPAERWDIGALYDPDPDAAGKMVTRSGGFVRDVDRFDASFFGISPREAVSLDPQHRLLLETSWEALERAGIAPDGLTGSSTGVFVGLMHRDYGTLVGGLEKLDGYVGTGSAPSIASGRISYVLGLQGPSMTVDTACSSSLVTVHLACQALRSGECSMALAGGATLMLTAAAFVEFSRLRGLALDGRCKSFSAAADGVGWSEGGGMLVLERLSDARRNGHAVLALIRGSAVNQDGRSNGLTAPNGPSQEAVIRRALGQAGVRPSEVDYVECHGTGTSLGDPIEVQALSAVLSEGRERDRPVVIGSVKSNLGHTQAAAGVAGIIKTVLALEHGRIPKNLHFDAPSPHIAWDALPVKVASEAVEWRRNGARRIAGVSSFGVSGTNAHVVLEEAPAREDAAEAPRLVARGAELVVVSAKSAAALDAAAGRLAAFVEAHAEHALGDLAYSLATTRAHHEHRLALSVQTRTELLAALDAASRGELPPSASRAELGLRGGKLAWLFTGQGSQTPGMGRGLHAEWPVFRDALDQAWAALDPHLEVALRDVMWAAPGTALAACLDQTAYSQPALFALEVALAALWRSWGVLPDLVAGHSIGELAAAHVAGVFSLDDAARLVAARGRLMQALPALGAMVSIGAPESVVAGEIGAYAASVSIAAVNGPESVVLSGAEALVVSIAERFANRGVRTKRLAVSHAFHSPLMDPMLEEFRRVAESVTYGKIEVALVSNVTGARAGAELATADYWVNHVRAAVRFGDGIRALHDAGATRFLELGPKATLVGLVPESLPVGSEPTLLASLRSERPESESVLDALGGHHADGGAIDWKGVFPVAMRRVELPTYAWQRERHWVAASPPPGRAGQPTGHPLLGVRVPVAGSGAIYESSLSLAEQPWLGDHRVDGRVFVPGTGLAEMMRAAAENRFEGAPAEVLSLVLQAPLVVPEHGAQRVQLVLAEEDGRLEVQLYSQPAESRAEAPWTSHATAEVRRAMSSGPAPLDLPSLYARCTEGVDVEQAYEGFAGAGLSYGPSFQGMRSLVRGAEEALASVVLPGTVGDAEAYGVHPALLDAAFHAVAGIRPDAEGRYLPFAIDRMIVHQSGAAAAVAYVRRTGDRESFAADVTLADAQGNVLVEVAGLRLKRADATALRAADAVSNAVYRLEWAVTTTPEPSALPAGRWVVVAAEADPVARALAERVRGAGRACTQTDWAHLGEALPAEHVVCIWNNGGEAEPADTALQMTAQGLAAVQTLATQAHSPRIVWVTHGAIAVTPGEATVPVASALWGLGRTVMAEHPELACRMVDVDAQLGAAEAGDVALRELSIVDDESQAAWRGGNRHVARLVRAPEARAALPATENYALEARRKGMLDQLTLVPASRRRPDVGEVEIAVAASGLNFRDVLNALGMYPGEAGPLGGECAGVVTAVGPGVRGFAVGDTVMALAAGSFQRFVTVDARLVAMAPAGVSLEQAATIPLVFLTAWYALHDLAGLKAGERLLVHAAAGGVGMAAVQVAHCIGARVLGTASPSKWSVVKSLGVEHVASSRDVGFVEAFRTATGGAGVDVVLNALSGEFVDASLSLLSAGGRFLEMGKTDIRDASVVSTAHPGIAYRAFDLLDAGPERIASMFEAILAGFAAGQLKALPVRRFPVTDAEAAFRFMAQARHVGKLALMPARERRSDGTVLITGGLGALGLEVARWLVGGGTKRLLLTGRRGLETPGARDAVAHLEGLGAEVTVAAVDVADRKAVAAMLAALPAEYPLCGVVHAAGVLDDGVLSGQSAERLARVMAPKVDGAIHLDALTRGADLDFFVLFSSVVGTLGAAGQGPYAAANAFLDGLAARRRAEGLPAQSLAWGPWAEGGMAASLNDAQKTRFATRGMKTLSSAEGVALLERVLDRSEAELVLVPLDLPALGRAFGGAVPPIWRTLLRAPRSAAGRAAHGAWAQELATLSSARRLEAVLQVVRSEVARVLSLAGPDRVGSDRPLKELGLDSLMAVELRNALGKRAGATLPSTLAFDYPTPGSIANYLLDKILTTGGGNASSVVSNATSRPSDEPIAIVGIGCRYPGGVNDPASFWRLLDGGLDAVTSMPRERWDVDALYDPDPDAAGKMTTRSGGFLQEVDLFDAEFFGISSREATSMDPQQRLLLETSWEAFERAGMAVASLGGSKTGVFVGLTFQDYGTLGGRGLEALDGYVGTGSLPSVASGRISYAFGLQGPSMTVDTACSSSLVTVHLACQALRSGECSVALAGGVALMLSPAVFVEFSRMRGLASDGRCKSFSAAADGVGWSEGCAMFVLERLSDAQRNGHPILAVIRGSAVNQDGRSTGLTAPNGPSQEAVIRSALEQAGVSPAEVQYVECHGTGTSLGDPIEVQALGAVMANGRDAKHPVVIGSVKSNIGHTQTAAGAAGLIKVVLALEHGRIPKNLHFDAPSPHIAWDELPVKVATDAVDWPRDGVRRIAGVSSFGISGTNAHVVVEEAPAVAPPPSAVVARHAEVVILTGRTAAAVNAAAARLGEHLETHPDERLGDIAFSLATSRTHHEHRVALSVTSRDALTGALASVAQGDTPAAAVRGATSPERGRLAWVFTGQGSQRVGMGRELYEEWPAFRETLDRLFAALDPHLPMPLRDVMWAEPGGAEATLLEQTVYTQPALFAFEVALAALWRSWKVEPDLLVGHSIGELSAAHVAGVFSLEDAARLVAARGRLMQALPAGGAMVSIAAPESEVSAAVAPHEAHVSIAAINGPDSVVISGAEAAVIAIGERFAARGVHTKRLAVSHAFHSPRIDPMLEEYRRVAESLTYRPAQVPLVSNLTGGVAGKEIGTADYWVRHVRAPVRFADGIRAIGGAATFLELGPKPTLLDFIPSCLPPDGPEVTLLTSLDPRRSEWDAILRALGSHYVHGGSVDWKGVFPMSRRRVNLPTYAWQRRRYWVEPREQDETVENGLRRLAESGLLSESALATLPELLATLALQRRAVATEGVLRRSDNETHGPKTGELRAALSQAAAEDRQGILERYLKTQAAQVLQTKPELLERDATLTNLGYDSIMSVKLQNRLVRALGSSLPANVTWQHPTIAALSNFLLARFNAPDEGSKAKIPPLVPLKRNGSLKLSFQQEQLWFFEQVTPGTAAYNLPVSLRVEGPLDGNALERAFRQLVNRHEALRTSIATVNGAPVQVISSGESFTVPIVDLEWLPDAEREAAALRHAHEEAAQPFDLARGPLFRAKLIRLGAEDHMVLMTMHHIVSDAWSMGVLESELAELYAAFTEGRTPHLPELPIHYADYAAWQRQMLTEEVLESQLAYWKRQLEGVPELEIPTDRPRPAVSSYRGRSHGFMLPKKLVERLRARSRSEDVTLFMTLLAAFQTLLHRYGGQEKIIVGSLTANRSRAELERSVGFFANTLVLATDFSGDPTFRELLQRVRAVSVGALAHDDFPFEKLVAELAPKRTLDRNPIYQVAIAAQPPLEVTELRGAKVSRFVTDSVAAKMDLFFVVVEVRDGLVGYFEYATDLFDHGTISRMAGHFEALCEGIVANPDSRISTLPILTDAERQMLLEVT